MSILSSLLKLGQGTPTQQIPTAVQTTEIAQEVAPFIKDILGKSQALYKERMAEGFVPFEGQTLADVTADQLAAQEGLRGLVGSQAGGLQEARELVRRQTQQATAEELQPFMNPYQQAVTDIAKRKAQERFEQETLPGLRKQAIDAGAFGGSRAAMRESQAQDAQARLLADIQAKGDLAAFQDARQAFEQQKTRERQAAEGLSGLTGAEFQARRAELGGLEAVGREQQQRQQQLLDESYQRFLQERGFPEQQLGTYQGFVSGASPFLRTTQTTMGPQQFQPSPIASALGTAAAGLGTFKAAQDLNLFSKEGGPVIPAEEGTPGGLRGIMIKIIRAQRGKGGDPRSKRAERERTQMQQEDVTRMLEEMDMQAGGLIDLPIVERQQSGIVRRGRIRGPQDVIDRPAPPSPLEQENQMLKETIENLAKENQMSGENTQMTEGEKDTQIMTETPVIEQKPTDGIPTESQAIKDLGTEISSFKTELDDINKKRLANIDASKDALKSQAQIDFLMGVSKGLLQGGTRGGLLADLTRGGQEGVEAVKDYQANLANLNNQELDVINSNLQDQFNLKTQAINLAFKKGELTREERKLAIDETNAQYTRMLTGINRASDSLNAVRSILTDNTTTKEEKKAELDQALADNIILPRHYRLKLDDIKTGDADTTGSKTEKNFGKTVNVKRNQ
jgi:hypothetical protein